MATLAVVTLIIEMSVMSAPAGATGRASTAYIDAPWADASFSVTRNGWVTTVRGHVKDTRADGDCTYVKASVYVDGWADPHKESPKNCHSAASGYSMPYTLTLRSAGGVGFHSIRVNVCADDFPPDSCEGRTLTINPDRAIHPERVGAINSYMSRSISSFLAAKAKHPAPYNWSDDGCSNSPDRPSGYNFLPACKRHDFGYRNYGNGLKASPLDSTRAYVNARFKSDLYNECAKHSGASGTACRRIADSYVGAVVAGGGPSFYGN